LDLRRETQREGYTLCFLSPVTTRKVDKVKSVPGKREQVANLVAGIEQQVLHFRLITDIINNYQGIALYNIKER